MEKETKIDLKKARNTFSKIGGIYTIFFVVTLLGQLILSYFIEMAHLVEAEWFDTYGLLLQMTPLYLVGFPLGISLFQIIPKTISKEKKNMSVKQFIQFLFMCTTVMYLGNYLGYFVSWIIGRVFSITMINAVSEIAINGNLIVNMILMVGCAPIVEEYLFRKLLIDRIVCYGEGITILVSGLLFGLFHGNFYQFFYAFFLGCMLAFIYIKTRRILYCWLAHATINFFGSVVSVVVLDTTSKMIEAVESMKLEKLLLYKKELTIYIGYVAWMFLAMIIGFILLVIKRGEFQLEKEGELELPKGKKLQIAFLNIGMLCFFCGCIWMFVLL